MRDINVFKGQESEYVMKKSVVVSGFLVALVFASLLPSVFAADGSPRTLGDMVTSVYTSVLSILEPVFRLALGTQESGATYAGQVLLLIILFSVLYALIDSGAIPMLDTGFVKWLVPLAVSILGVRFLPASFVETAALPSGAFAVAVTALIPMVGFYFITRGFPQFLQRVAWAFLGIVFLGLWSVREVQLGDVAWIYPTAALACLFMAWFEGVIGNYIRKSRMSRAKAAGTNKALDQLEKLRGTISTDFADPSTGGANYKSKFGFTPDGLAAYKQDMREINRRIDVLL